MAKKKNSTPTNEKILSSKDNRGLFFRGFKKFLKFTGRYKKPDFIYLGKEFDYGGIILSNHEGTDAPLSLELYIDKPLRMWGAHEMNSGVVKMYKYQSRVYYHEKKGWNLHLARLFCLIASPLTNLFYKGLNLISTYQDARFVKTIKESYEAILRGENIVIFPEVSDKGYLEVLEGFHEGFLLLAEFCYKKGIDLPIYVTYFNKKKLRYMVDEPISYSKLLNTYFTRERIAKYLLDRCNELGALSNTNDPRAEIEKQANSNLLA